MNILVTGNKGYIGTVLCETLLKHGYDVWGLDVDFYRGCELKKFKELLCQMTKDVRDILVSDLKNVDAVIHLAALSNDPLGELSPQVTRDINLNGTVRLAHCAKEAGVKRFIFASSQSIYGISNTQNELDEEDSLKNPLTMYAQTKWEAECYLKKMNSPNFSVTCLRPSTVFGVSPKLRCDIVFNNFVGCAYTTGKIEIKSDGTPWRPVIHVRDVARAFLAVLEAPLELVSGQSFNVGMKEGNFRVRELAEIAQKMVVGSKIAIQSEEVNDSRTYRVSFNKILTVLGGYYKPEWNLLDGAGELVYFFKEINFTREHFIGRHCNRLKHLQYLVHLKQMDEFFRLR